MDTISQKARKMLDEVSKIKSPHSQADSHLIDLVIEFVKEVIIWSRGEKNDIRNEIGMVKEEIGKIEKKQNGHAVEDSGKT